MKKWMIIVLILVLIPVLVLGYLGFIPGVSAIMGSNRPKDLGVSYTNEDLASLMAKNGIQDAVLPDTDVPRQGLIFSGSKPVKNTFTQEELTARMNDYTKLKYNSLSDIQIRVNDDGTTEISGRIDLKNTEGCFIAFGMPQQDYDELKPYIDKAKILNPKPSFYAKSSLSVVNNQIELNLEEAKIGRVVVPTKQIPDGYIERVGETMLGNIDGLDIKSLTFKDGKMSYEGSVPAKVSGTLKG